MKVQFTLVAALTTLAIALGMSVPAEATPSPTANSAIQCMLDRVQAHQSEWFTYRVNAGQRIDILLQGDGDTDLDLYVYDQSGRLIVRDINPTDFAHVWLRSPIQQTLRIEVRNLGRVWNAFHLCVE